MALIVVSVVVCLVLSEVAVRLFFPQRLYYNVSQWDPDVGFTEIPNLQSVQRNPEYTMTIRINSRGLRDREFAFEKPPRTIRLGVFGDSFTFGEGVEAEQTYAKCLEQLFAKDLQLASAGWHVEVLNFGIGKTGTSHQLAWYRKEGVRYHLDMVILGFLPGNDFDDNLAGVYRLSGGELVHDRAAYSSIRTIQSVVYSIPGYRWLAEHSQLLNLVRVVATRLDDRHRLAQAAAAPHSDSQGRDGYAVELTRRLIEEFAIEARANGSKFVLLYLPGRDQRPSADDRPIDSVKPSLIKLGLLQDRLKSSQLSVIDFEPVFARLPTQTFYYRVDGHWRPAGHEVVASELYRRLAPDIYARIDTPEARSHFHN